MKDDVQSVDLFVCALGNNTTSYLLPGKLPLLECAAVLSFTTRFCLPLTNRKSSLQVVQPDTSTRRAVPYRSCSKKAPDAR